MELCEGMSVARSLDEVILCHDVYLTSIQKQCLVAPDKVVSSVSSTCTLETIETQTDGCFCLFAGKKYTNFSTA